MLKSRISQGAVAQASRIARPGQQHGEGQRQQRPGRRHHQRLGAGQPRRDRSQHRVVQRMGRAGIEARHARRGRSRCSARMRRTRSCDRRRADPQRRRVDPAVAEAKHPAGVAGQGDGDERLARLQRAQHVGGGHHLLHQLAVIRCGGVQRGVGIREVGLGGGDALVQVAGAARREPARTVRRPVRGHRAPGDRAARPGRRAGDKGPPGPARHPGAGGSPRRLSGRGRSPPAGLRLRRSAAWSGCPAPVRRSRTSPPAGFAHRPAGARLRSRRRPGRARAGRDRCPSAIARSRSVADLHSARARSVWPWLASSAASSRLVSATGRVCGSTSPNATAERARPASAVSVRPAAPAAVAAVRVSRAVTTGSARSLASARSCAAPIIAALSSARPMWRSTMAW